MFQNFISKEKINTPLCKWPLVSVIVLVLVSTTMMLIDECKELGIIFPVVEEVTMLDTETAPAITSEQPIAPSYPTEDVTKRNTANIQIEEKSAEWPTAEEMKKELEDSHALPANQATSLPQVSTTPFVWPTAEEMKKLLGQNEHRY